MDNVFKGKKNDKQPWKEYYKGMKPSNPLGGNIVRRMGNKVKGIVSSRVGGNKMSFNYNSLDVYNFSSGSRVTYPIVTFGSQPIGYVPPYKPLGQPLNQGQPPAPMANQATDPNQSTDPNQAAPNLPPGMTMEDYKMYMKQKRETERSNRENSRDARRSISDTRASYRTILDTGREGRNWLKFIG